MGVLGFQIFTQLSEVALADGVAVLVVGVSHHGVEALGWVLGYIGSCDEPFGESLEPCEVVVAGLKRVVALYKYIIKEFPDYTTVELVDIVHVLVGYPILQYLHIAHIACHCFKTIAVFLRHLCKPSLIL